MYKVAARDAGFPCCFPAPEDRIAIKKKPSTLHCDNRRDGSRAPVELFSLILEFSSFNSLQRCCFEQRGIRLPSGTGLPKKVPPISSQPDTPEYTVAMVKEGTTDVEVPENHHVCPHEADFTGI